jgi:hypothetical protein
MTRSSIGQPIRRRTKRPMTIKQWIGAAALLGLVAATAPAPAETPAAPSAGEIEAAVAPVALYPDALLTPLLMAASYPEEVAEADGWLGQSHNDRLKGDALAAALEPLPWDPSVKALTPFPVILDMMAMRPAWVDKLGRAFVAAPATVMADIQALRRQAIADGMLASSPRLMVRDSGGTIAIASADPAVVYIPVYNPALVFGAWSYPDNPPVFIEPPDGFRISGADMQTGIGFSVGFGVLESLWGWATPDWSNGAVAVDTAAYNRINRYGPHVAAAIWHHEAHPTGYFHIAQAQITPVPPEKHGHEHGPAVAAKAGAKSAKNTAKTAARHRTHETRHAKGHDRAKTRIAHGAPPRHGKIRLASDGRRGSRVR